MKWHNVCESGFSVHSIIQIVLVLFLRGVSRSLAAGSSFYYLKSKKDWNICILRREWRRAKSMPPPPSLWLGTRKPQLLCGNDPCHLGHQWGLGVWVTQILPSGSDGGNPRKGLRWSSKRKTPFPGLMTNDISLKSGLRGFFDFLPRGWRSSEISPLFTLSHSLTWGKDEVWETQISFSVSYYFIIPRPVAEFSFTEQVLLNRLWYVPDE